MPEEISRKSKQTVPKALTMTNTPRYQSELVDALPLGKPLHFEFCGKTAQNRFLKAAMTERLSSWDTKDIAARGIPSKSLVNVYRHWGESNIGTIVTGNIMIEYDQLESPGNAVIPPDAGFEGERFEAFKDWASQCKKHGSILVGQVCHPGRQVDETIQTNPISASDVQLMGKVLGRTYAKPHPATEDEIKRIINSWAHAAEYLYNAGFDGIEIHAAHGYLLSQFLAPGTNHRTDNYGGNLENRSRLIFEIVDEIRKQVPSGFLIGVKLNSVEFQDGGFDEDDCKKLCEKIEANNFDFVELSGGTYEQVGFRYKRDSMKKREAFFLDFAEVIVPALHKCKTFVTGGFKTVGSMVKALDIVDGIGLGRVLCQEPRFVLDVLAGKIQGAIQQRLDPMNYPLTNVAAGTQIRQIGKNEEPIDLSVEENEVAFRNDMAAWMGKKANDKERKEVGYIDITSVPVVPYKLVL